MPHTQHDLETCNLNHGVLLDIRPEDWFAGVTSLIPYEVRNVSANWTSFAPPGEWQRDDDTDTMACVSYAHNNEAEMQLNQFLWTGQLSDYKIKRCIELGYLKSVTGMVINFDAVKANPRNFSFDLSDRALAKFSDTTHEGNWLWKVGDTYRNIGVVAERRWPSPSSYTWDSYYTEIPADVKAECGEFLKMFSVAYEFLQVTHENIVYHLKHVPLQMVIPGHDVVGIYKPQDYFDYFDTYDPFFKQRVGLPQTAMKLVITIKPDNMPIEFLRVFRIQGDPDGKVFAILKGKSYWITPGGMPGTIYEDGRGVLWADVGPGNTAIITKEEAAKYPFSGTFGKPTLVEYFKSFFL